MRRWFCRCLPEIVQGGSVGPQVTGWPRSGSGRRVLHSREQHLRDMHKSKREMCDFFFFIILY